MGQFCCTTLIWGWRARACQSLQVVSDSWPYVPCTGSSKAAGSEGGGGLQVKLGEQFLKLGKKQNKKDSSWSLWNEIKPCWHLHSQNPSRISDLHNCIINLCCFNGLRLHWFVRMEMPYQGWPTQFLPEMCPQEMCRRVFRTTVCSAPHLEITQMLVQNRYVVTQPAYSSVMKVTCLQLHVTVREMLWIRW